MLKKYLILFSAQLAANLLWIFWVLPGLGESGSPAQTIKWFGVQVLVPVFLLLLIARRRKSGYGLTVVYSILVGLYAMGMLGWALIGEATPLSVYVVCIFLFIVAFGALFCALKDLNVGQKARRYNEIRDE